MKQNRQPIPEIVYIYRPVRRRKRKGMEEVKDYFYQRLRMQVRVEKENARNVRYIR
ncbi:MAG: hypothetical protein HYT70_03670 [Candidatus Aenigmarchaeota archaeon]|nr:hypothetical protein [Candidatus Aenigmarchaeota archaeon]